MVNYLETSSLIDDEQNGFRKDRSCEDHIFTLTSILRNRKNANLDKSWYLYTKLAKIGVTGNFLDTLKQLYTDCQAAVDVNGTYTAFLDINSGVKQGDVISPTLLQFSLMIFVRAWTS